jgi:hypothetical protein
MQYQHTSTVSAVYAIPVGMEDWLLAFLEEARAQSCLLRENGAVQQADAREAIVRLLLDHARRWYAEPLSIRDAAELSGLCEETVRRGVRSGHMPPGRLGPSGPHRVRRGDAISLAAKPRESYDPAADARRVALLRRNDAA